MGHMASERVDVAAREEAGEAGERAAAGELGRRIVRLRRRRGWQQAELAQRLGVTRMRLGNWERGLHEPPLAALQALRRELGVSFEELLTGERAPLALSSGQKAEARVCLSRLAQMLGLACDLVRAAAPTGKRP